jgi:hypothetical protein
MPKPSEPSEDAADSMIRTGEVLQEIGKALKPLEPEARRRVIKAVAALYGIELRDLSG